MKRFPTLYKKTVNGEDQQWTIAVSGRVLIIRWGRVGGKYQEARDEVKAGKNLGRESDRAN